MSVLEVLTYPNTHLSKATQTVQMFDAELDKKINHLFETMYHDQGCGLAANQVGYSEAMFVMDTSRDESNPICLINPEIIHTEGVTTSEEGCLSFPGAYIKVQRAQKITVRFQDPKGVLQELSLEGLSANCVQHEGDHLKGVLFIDHLSNFKKNRLLKKIAKYKQYQE